MNRNNSRTTCITTLSVITFLILSSTATARAEDKPKRKFELKAESPAFWKLIPKQAKLETIATGFGFTEGPVWDKSGFVYVSDEEINKIFRVYPDGHKEDLIALGDPDGNTYDRQLRLIDTASVLRAIIRITPDGKYTVLADHFEGKKLNSPNDVVIGPDGAIYFTDPTLDLVKGETQEIPFQGVYRLDDSGKVTLLTKDLTQPNGLAFSQMGSASMSTTARRKIFASTMFVPTAHSQTVVFSETKREIRAKASPTGCASIAKEIFSSPDRRESGSGIRRDTTLARSLC